METNKPETRQPDNTVFLTNYLERHYDAEDAREEGNSEKNHKYENLRYLTWNRMESYDILSILSSKNRKELSECIDEVIDKLEKTYAVQTVDSSIFSKKTYGRLQEYINNKLPISEKSGLWEELSETVCELYPNFIKRWRFMTDGKANKIDYRIALLLKCKVSLANIAILIGRSKGAVSLRREKISILMFGTKIEYTKLDKFIYFL